MPSTKKKVSRSRNTKKGANVISKLRGTGGFRFHRPTPLTVDTWNVSFGTVSGVGFVGSSWTFTTIFTSPPDLASRLEIELMCWAFSCFTAAFAAGASLQVFFNMVTPPAKERPTQSKHRWVLSAILYFCVSLLLTGTLLLGLAIMQKVKGAGVMAIVLPSLFVLAAVVATAYLNHFVTETKAPQPEDVESRLESQSTTVSTEFVGSEKY